MNLTGYNPEVVSTAMNNIQGAYNELADALTSQIQSNFVGRMAELWASPNAVTFFGNFAEVMNGVISTSNLIFSSVKGAMNDAALQWAMNAGEPYTSSPFEENGSRIDVSAVQPEIAGVRGIDRDNAVSTANGALSTVQGNVTSALQKANSAVQSCGFVGGSQAANLQASLGQIQTNVNNAFEELKQSLEKAISDTVQQYSDTEGKISQAFAGN